MNVLSVKYQSTIQMSNKKQLDFIPCTCSMRLIKLSYITIISPYQATALSFGLHFPIVLKYVQSDVMHP